MIDAPRHQRYLGDRGVVALVALLSAFVPLSTDLYLPPSSSGVRSVTSTTAGRGPPDAGAAEGGHRLGLGADRLLRAAAQESG